MNGNSPISFSEYQSPIYFFLILLTLVLVYKAYKKDTGLGILATIGAGLGTFYFFTDPSINKLITSVFAAFFLMVVGYGVWTEIKR